MSIENLETKSASQEVRVEDPERNVEDYSNLEQEVLAEIANREASNLDGSLDADFRSILESFAGRADMYMREMEEKLRNIKKEQLH